MKLSFDVSDTAETEYSASGVNGSLVFRERPFEAECFGNRTAEVLDWTSTGFPALFSQFLDDEGFVSGDLLYLRLHADDIVSIQQAEAAGFYFIESSIIPFLKTRYWERDRYKRFICPLSPVEGNIDEVEEIAMSTFRGLRFNLDPHVGDERADARYLKWLRNAYENGEDIRILKHRDSIAGFSLLRFEDESKAVFRLAGMRPDLKNAGLGMMLYASTTAYCQDQGIKHIDGGISMANTPVLNVMSNLGYAFKDPTVVLHYYVS